MLVVLSVLKISRTNEVEYQVESKGRTDVECGKKICWMGTKDDFQRDYVWSNYASCGKFAKNGLLD